MKNLLPSRCQGCNALMGGSNCLTLIHGKWLCPYCQDKERRGTPLERN